MTAWLTRFWPALLGLLLAYALWPLLWLVLNFGTLSKQEPDAARLLATAPQVYVTGQPQRVGGSEGTGESYLMRKPQQMRDVMQRQGWQWANQMGAGQLFIKGKQERCATCRMFSRYFAVCEVKSS